MGKEKRKKRKKSPQTKCETSSAAKNSYGMKINRDQNSDSTECTGLTKTESRNRANKDNALVKKATPKDREDEITKHSSLGRRIGRWIAKKVSKEKKEGQIPSEHPKPISATLCTPINEPSSLHIFSQQAVEASGPEEITHASADADICVKPDGIASTADVLVNSETIRNIVVSLLTELCTAVVDIANSTNTDTYDSKNELVNKEAHSKDQEVELSNSDKKPECFQITVMSLKEMCKSEVTNSDHCKCNINDRHTDHIDSDETNGLKLDKTSLSSELDDIVTMILSEICRRVIHYADNSKTMVELDKMKTTNAELDTRDAYPEYDTGKVLSLKDLCSAVVETTATVTKADTEKDPVDDGIDAVECHRARILSLIELCAAAIRNVSDLKSDVSENDTAAVETENNEFCKAFDSKTSITEQNPENDEITTKTSKEIWPVADKYTEDMMVSIHATKMNQIYDKDHKKSNDIEPDNDEIKPNSSNTPVNSLKEVCLELMINKNDAKSGIVNTVNTVECHTDQQSSDSDKRQVESTEVIAEPSDIYPTSSCVPVMSLKQLCTAVLGDANEGVKGTCITGDEKIHNYHETVNEKNDNKNEKPCADPEKNEIKSLKEVCTVATRQSDEATVRMLVTEQDQALDKYQTDSYDAKPYYSVISLNSEKASAKTLLDMYYNAIGNADEVLAGETDIEEDYVFVDVPDYINYEGQYLANNFEIKQNDDKSQTEFICEVSSTASENSDDSDTTVIGTAADLAFRDNYEKSLDLETDNSDFNPHSDKLSIQSQVKQCLEEVITAGKMEDEIHEKQATEDCDYKTYINSKLDQSETKSLLINLPATRIDPSNEKSGVNFLQEGHACGQYIETGAALNDIIPGNEKATSIHNKELCSAGISNDYGMRTSMSDTKQNKPTCKKESTKFETDTNGILSNYENASPVALKEVCKKAVIRIDDTVKELNHTEEDPPGKFRDAVDGTRADMTENLQKHYFLTRGLMSLIGMWDKETRQKEDEDPDDNIADERDTRKVCGKTLLHLATNLNKLTDTKMNVPVIATKFTTNNGIQQELTQSRYPKAKQNSERNTDPLHETQHFYIDNGMPERDIAIRKNSTDSISKPKRSQSDDITYMYQQNYGDTTEIVDDANNEDHGTVLTASEINHANDKSTISEEIHASGTCNYNIGGKITPAKNDTNEKKEDHVESLQDTQQKHSAKRVRSVESGNMERHEQSSDTEAYYTPESSSSHVDEECQIQNRTAYSDKQELDTDIAEQGVDNNTHVTGIIAAALAHNDNTNLERYKQKIGNEVTHKLNGQTQVQDFKTVSVTGRDTKHDTMMAKINETVGAARTMALGTGKVYGSDSSKNDSYKTAFASENDNHDSFLPIETIFRLMVDTYNERKESKKKKLGNEVRLHCDIDYQINMDENIAIAEQLTENGAAFTNNGHTLTDNEHPLPISGEDKTRRKQSKSREVESNGEGSAGEDIEIDNTANHSGHQTLETATGAMPLPNSENTEDENMILPDDLTDTPETTQKFIANQTVSEVSGLIDGQQETEENHQGAEEKCHRTDGGSNTGLVGGHHRAEHVDQGAEERCQGDDEGTHTEFVDGHHKDEEKHQDAEEESCQDPTSTDPVSSTTETSQGSLKNRKKKQKRKRAKRF